MKIVRKEATVKLSEVNRGAVVKSDYYNRVVLVLDWVNSKQEVRQVIDLLTGVTFEWNHYVDVILYPNATLILEP